MANVIVQHALQGGEAVLEHDLQLAGVFDAEAAPRDQAEHGRREDDEGRHHEVIRDDVAVRCRPAERAQQRRDRGAERSIHGLDDSEFVL